MAGKTIEQARADWLARASQAAGDLPEGAGPSGPAAETFIAWWRHNAEHLLFEGEDAAVWPRGHLEGIVNWGDQGDALSLNETPRQG